ELIDFFASIKNNTAMQATPHIKIKELDYSFILSNKGGKASTEQEIWQFIVNIAEESQKNGIQEAKIETLINFLKNSDKSASILNDLYRESISKGDDKATIDNIRRVFVKIYKYFENNLSQDVKEIRNDLTNILVKFPPKLLAGMFEKTEIDGENYDLAKEITKDFSDDTISDFMVSLLNRENSVNENLLKVFDKLVSGKEKDKISDVVSLAADKLFSKNLPDKDIEKLQQSITDLFQTHSNNEFMSQIYKKTVEVFLGNDIGAVIDKKKAFVLISTYKEFLKHENMVREKTRCLLNILWLEENPDVFEKITRKLIELFPELFDLEDVKSIREIFELFIDHLRLEQKENKFIELQAKIFLNEITKTENIEKIISFIPKAKSDALEDIGYILSKTQTASLDLLLNAFLKDKNPYNKHKFNSVLVKMKTGVLEKINHRLNSAKDNFAIKDLLKVLKFIDPERAHKIATKMLNHKNIEVRLEALDNFLPETKEEMNIIFKFFKKEKDESVKTMAIGILVNTKDNNTLKDIFVYLERSFFRRKYLLKLVKSCGNLKISESVPFIKKVLKKTGFLNIPNRDELRVAAVISLGQIGTPEALRSIEQRLNDKRARVRRMCQIILEQTKSRL
ncbi:MAG: HEAT repeat domain-containing protein, partial [bacterium]